MYSLLISELAQTDLENTIEYISDKLGSPPTASIFLDEVERCYEFLRSNPFIYSKCEDPKLEKEGYRKAGVKNYLIIFKIDESEKAVMIYRILYGARDYLKLI